MKALAAALAILAIAPATAWASPQSDLMAADRAFSKLSVAKGQGYAFLAYLTSNGRLYGSGDNPPVYGKPQAFRSLARARGNGTVSWVPEAASVSSDAKMGWTDGHWLSIARGNGARSTGHYLTVWVRERRGWKVQAAMRTTDPAPPIKK